jgi:hypothetical protein
MVLPTQLRDERRMYRSPRSLPTKFKIQRNKISSLAQVKNSNSFTIGTLASSLCFWLRHVDR